MWHMASGGPDVGAFRSALTIPDNPITWTNQDAISQIPRSQDLTVNWSSSATIAVLGSSANPSTGAGAAFYCIPASADSSSLTVPAWVLSSLPASGPASDLPVPVGFLALGVTLSSPARFQTTGIDAGYFNWAWARIKNVQYK